MLWKYSLPCQADTAVRVEYFGDEIDRISEINAVTGEVKAVVSHAAIFPASHYVVGDDKLEAALTEIDRELAERIDYFQKNNKLIEAQRIEQRTHYDMEMLREVGYCSGVENYSRVLAGRPPGSTPQTLMDHFPEDFLLIVDEEPCNSAAGPCYVRRRPCEKNYPCGLRFPSAERYGQPSAEF